MLLLILNFANIGIDAYVLPKIRSQDPNVGFARYSRGGDWFGEKLTLVVSQRLERSAEVITY